MDWDFVGKGARLEKNKIGLLKLKLKHSNI
jgi:hypothetical protein